MTEARVSAAEPITIHWPEPAHLRLETVEGAAEPCEIEFDDGTLERGDLLRFTGRDDELVFRPGAGHPRHPARIVARNSRIKRLRLTDPVAARPVDVAMLGGAEATISSSQVHVYTVEFTDHEIESGDTLGFVRNAIGLFLYFSRPDERLERVFIPESAIAYFQAGDPIGRVLVEENAVSEEQLQAAVEKQHEMRKLVLGDYLIDEGLIEARQLEQALAHQKTKPSLRLGEALIEMGAIRPEALQIALSRQRANRGRPLAQILIDMGVVDADTLNKIHAKKMGHHFVSLAHFTVSDEAVAAIPASAAWRLGIVPLSIEHGDLIIATESQLDPSAINELTLLSRMRIVPVMASGQEIKARRVDAYSEPADDGLADASTIRFESMDLEGTTARHEDADADTEQRFTESLDGHNDPHLIAAIDRAVRAVEGGGTLEIHIEAKQGLRTTRIRLHRDR